MVYKGLDASISPATLLSLARVPMHTVNNCVWKEVCTALPLVTHSLLAWLPHVSIGFKQRSDILGLAAPDVAMNGPIESEF